MSDVFIAVMGGLISGAFSAGVLWSMVKSTIRTASRAEGKIDDHITNHANGVFRHG